MKWGRRSHGRTQCALSVLLRIQNPQSAGKGVKVRAARLTTQRDSSLAHKSCIAVWQQVEVTVECARVEDLPIPPLIHAVAEKAARTPSQLPESDWS